MNILLDAHTFLWFVGDDPKLSSVAKGHIVNPANRKHISIVTLWELAIKVNVNRLDLGEKYTTFIHREIPTNNIAILPIRQDHNDAYVTLKLHHRDPFDRMLIAQAIVEIYPIVSADVKFDMYPITRLW